MLTEEERRLLGLDATLWYLVTSKPREDIQSPSLDFYGDVSACVEMVFLNRM